MGGGLPLNLGDDTPTSSRDASTGSIEWSFAGPPQAYFINRTGGEDISGFEPGSLAIHIDNKNGKTTEDEVTHPRVSLLQL